MSATPSPDEASQARPPLLRLLLPIAVIVAILAGITVLLVGGSSKPSLPAGAKAAKAGEFAGLTLSPRVPAPPLDTLRNFDGSSFDLAAERGRAVFVTFLYSHCPDVCPLIASNLHNAYASMTPAMRKKVAIVAVSVDPHGDTAGAVRAFVHAHQLTGEARYLIGPASKLAKVWEAWKVGSEADTSNPELVNHSALIYGISASGKLTTIYDASFRPHEVVHDVAPLLRS